MANKIQGGTNNAGIVNVDANYQLKVSPETDILNNPEFIGAVKIVSENDGGTKTGTPYILSPETDDDYRLRVAMDTQLDDETFNYTAQNTGKHNNQSTTMTYTYGTGGLLTNGSSITTTTTGLSLSTYAMFPMFSNGSNLYNQSEISFSSQPVANTIVDFGMFLRPTSNPYAPTDGVYFRLNSSGLFGVINHNGTETTTSLFSFTYANNTVYKFLLSISNISVEFWIDDVLYAELPVPVAQAQPFMSVALPFSFRHAIVGGAAGGIFQATLRGYGVSLGGINISKSLGEIGNAVFGSYQGLSGGTMGSLSTYVNSTNPTAAVPANASLTANLPSGLGGMAFETFTLAVNTDGILMSYQVPAGTVSIPGKRLKVVGVKLSSFVQTVLAGAPLIRTFALNFGHTVVSIAAAESATAKARRVVLLPELTQAVTAAQAVSTMLSQPLGGVSMFTEPIYVNPGEFISLSVKHIGTVGTSGTIATSMQYIYSWE
jgi:hypothetical protein